MEDFGYQRDGETNKFSEAVKRVFLVFATLFSLAVFVYVTINAYYFIYQDKNADIETIKSPEGPIKVIEEEQNQNAAQIDRSIYEDIFGSKKESLKTENVKVRKLPEAPRPPIQREENKKENTATKEQKIIVYSNKNETKPAHDLLTNLQGEKRDNTASPAPKPSNKKRAVRVQVAAMTSKEAAEENWKRLNRLHPNLFSGYKPIIEKADLGKRGIFYRLQVGDFYNQIDAEEFCNRYVIQAHKTRADCIVVE
ncbi:MAG: hypothetical protein A2887_05060 [Alphaproteobacteria bacterium RIFCSPLOWO2_01_FULL_40_26]|nr:MAG: hypothetical protein A3D15_03580 [Alphaproteobacteria bacterium RIFCSPHIGHO2_02_FULL_40_34]OFW88361.1 MAG: hypothetical protein A2794_02415 [Alphaproteobacteria bacterium RIFCSPHIGHO2_01_FULL_40_8]OFW94304.1 MAG: hypothetical protein A2887_05060 [Alphaproteobacteria bacterium RIFCSPLOWO2_01_FULL_40_26]OFX09989.1 MAG: hypothetical protein A3H30_02850 [Alphaproteobacteria bacterium RIFCSPLOWO2_02_FULL_40_19]OFX11068.1 MAG: hypothetical protein A3G22_05755 [Alphaproteobacteria bacterium RI